MSKFKTKFAERENGVRKKEKPTVLSEIASSACAWSFIIGSHLIVFRSNNKCTINQFIINGIDDNFSSNLILQAI